MPVIAYQSLNSNSKTDHNISASNSQHFTRLTQQHLASHQERWMLSLPTAPGISPDIPVHGPAELLASAPKEFMNKGQHSDVSFLTMVSDKARQTHQNLIRELGVGDLLVYGELDSSHTDWTPMQNHAGPLNAVSTSVKACNTFSVHSNSSNVHYLAEGFGWIAMKVYNVIAVFVHVPNDIAKDLVKAIAFYQDIQTKVLHKGVGMIDIILGDTNQSNNQFTEQVVSKALGTPFADAHRGNMIEPADAYQRSFGGTNSTATKKYDVAVYNTATVKVQKLIYLSQATPTQHNGGSRAAAITDHMGIGVKLEK